MTIGEWMEDRYFDGLLREADARALRNIFRVSASDEAVARSTNSVSLIFAIYSFCKLSRKIAEKSVGRVNEASE